MVAPDVPAPAPTPPKKNSSGVDDNVLAHLRKIPALFTVYVRGKSQTDFAKLSKYREVAYAETAGAITFTTEDMMLGDRDHSRQAFVSQGASE